MSTPLEPRPVNTPPGLSSPITVPLVSRRRERAVLVQKLQHAIPAAALLYAGARGLLAHERGLGLSLALGELAFGLLLLRSMAAHVRAVLRGQGEDKGEAHVGVDWSEIFAAAVLAVEALEHWHTRGHFPRPIGLLAAVTLLAGLTHGRLAAYNLRRRALRIDDEGLRFGGRFFRRFSATWDEILRIDIAPQSASIETRSGRTRQIDIADLRHPEAVTAALVDAQQRLAEWQAGESLTALAAAGTLQPGSERQPKP